MSDSKSTSLSSLIAQNFYDPKLIPTLEDHVNAQCRSSSPLPYDAEANRYLLKLYSLNPDTIRPEFMTRILLKSLTCLPSHDYLDCFYLIPERFHHVEPFQSIFSLISLLEQGQYKQYWQQREQHKALFDQIPHHDEAIRLFICLTISFTFTSISMDLFKEWCNIGNNQTIYNDLMDEIKWNKSEDGKIIRIPNQNKENNGVNGGRADQQFNPMEQVAKVLANTNRH
jgi:translation initiation factor 3 subunit K